MRRAIDPWVKWKAAPAERVKEVTTHLTVLPNASLQAIRRACAETEYTHVHILAHGQKIERQGHYGLTLCSDTDGGQQDVVDGEALATALTARDSMGTARSRPTVVSLATCDSGNAGSVITAGGSVAHALHAGGIPWVIASQFPLWMHASSVATEVLYRGLLRGDDPRWVLYTLRQRLRTDSTATHDWASIVAYAVVPWNFGQNVEAFRNRQTRQRIERRFDEAEQRLAAATQSQDCASKPAGDAEVAALYEAIRHDLAQWCQALPAAAPPHERVGRLGMSAASEKRIGDLYRGVKDESKAITAYEKAMGFYRDALEADPVNDWVLTQYLSMLAVLGSEDEATLAQEYGAWWSGARQIATWALRTGPGEKRVWALGTLAELELLGAVYAGPTFKANDARKEIVRLCRELVDAVGKDAFPVFSTQRQFTRYLTRWPRESWNGLAECAIDALPTERRA
jgi:tetratricopeptide (TPR) repeat protein